MVCTGGGVVGIASTELESFEDGDVADDLLKLHLFFSFGVEIGVVGF